MVDQLVYDDSQSNIQRIDQKFNIILNHQIRNRQQQRFIRVSPLAKFSESTWRFTFYLSIFLYGIIILKNVRLTKMILFYQLKYLIVFALLFLRKFGYGIQRHCWLNYPNHQLTNDVYWYYMIELAFYWSLVFYTIY